MAGVAMCFPAKSSANITDLGMVPTAMGQLPLRRAWVNRPKLIRQECAEWCWAASLAMIFEAFEHSIDQKAIVVANFGGLACAPASTTLRMARNLSATWTDRDGDDFTSTVTAAYDPSNGIVAINNAIIINELAEDRPLLYANRHHAMVVVSMEFIDGPMGPQPTSVGVLDPWPYSPGYHPLSASEARPAHLGGDMTFLASVEVD